jgi:peroxiredoxin
MARRRSFWLVMFGAAMLSGCGPVGSLAHEIEGNDADGKPMKLSDFRGKVVLLDFWATW